MNGVVAKLLQTYWRFSRGLTLGVRAMVLTPDLRVLLIKHGYQPGWHFPGGGVEFDEQAETALARELEEEAGVALTARPELAGIFHSGSHFRGDHVVLYRITAWRQPQVPAPNREIVAQGFFALDALPPETTDGTRRRLEEFKSGLPAALHW